MHLFASPQPGAKSCASNCLTEKRRLLAALADLPRRAQALRLMACPPNWLRIAASSLAA